eukprot:s4236_g3.t1
MMQIDVKGMSRIDNMATAGLGVPYKWDHLENVGDVYTPRTGHAVVNEDGVFYLFGGTDGAARQSDVHAYNVETNLWQEIRAGGRPPPARSGAQAVVWSGAVWFFGGYTKKDFSCFSWYLANLVMIHFSIWNASIPASHCSYSVDHREMQPHIMQP